MPSCAYVLHGVELAVEKFPPALKDSEERLLVKTWNSVFSFFSRCTYSWLPTIQIPAAMCCEPNLFPFPSSSGPQFSCQEVLFLRSRDGREVPPSGLEKLLTPGARPYLKNPLSFFFFFLREPLSSAVIERDTPCALFFCWIRAGPSTGFFRAGVSSLCSAFSPCPRLLAPDPFFWSGEAVDVRSLRPPWGEDRSVAALSSSKQMRKPVVVL